MGHGKWLSPKERAAVMADLRSHSNKSRAARDHHVSYSTVQAIDRELKRLDRPDDHEGLPPPIPYADLSREAKRGLEDLSYFRRRYLGHVSLPWHLETERRVTEALSTEEKEFIVENAPPGPGKTTLLHDIAAQAVARDRAIRGLFGSRTQVNATRQNLRLRRTLERTSPVRARPDLLAKGLACDAEATMAADYGRFKPERGEVWRADAFVVLQFDDEPIEEKEPTWSAYGVDSGVLGNRFRIIMWDDLVDRWTIRHAEAGENLQKLWDEELETRLEPGGVLFLVGQRMDARDLYRYCLDKVDPAKADGDDPGRMYQRIIFPAHDETRCQDWTHHPKWAKPWPEGCLLDPYRLPWKELRQIAENRPERYRVLYQQEDLDPTRVLVHPVWVNGGTDHEGVACPGCWDRDRGRWELPSGIVQPILSIAMADPSPTKFWGLIAMAYHPPTEQRFVLNVVRQEMAAPDFLEWHHNTRTFSGLMENWWQASAAMGHPIRYWVVEDNGAQRFLLQFEHVRRWCALRGCSIIPHNTHRVNKADDRMGVTSLGPHWRHGRVRLPGRDRVVTDVTKLVNEVIRYPHGAFDDLTMALWFGEHALSKLWSPMQTRPPESPRPSWVKELARI